MKQSELKSFIKENIIDILGEATEEEVANQKELNIMHKKLMPSVNNLRDKLYSINNQFLGEKGLYHQVEKLRNTTDNLRDDIVRFLKSKQFIK